MHCFSIYRAESIVLIGELWLFINFNHVIRGNKFFNIHLLEQLFNIRRLCKLLLVTSQSNRSSCRFARLGDLYADGHAGLWPPNFTDMVVVLIQFFSLVATLHTCVYFFYIFRAGLLWFEKTVLCGVQHLQTLRCHVVLLLIVIDLATRPFWLLLTALGSSNAFDVHFFYLFLERDLVLQIVAMLSCHSFKKSEIWGSLTYFVNVSSRRFLS